MLSLLHLAATWITTSAAIQTNARSWGAILSSLAAFIAAGAKPPTPLAKAIVVVLVIKLIAIGAIKVLMFSGSAQTAVDPNAMARVMGPTVLSH
jgi:hypothetical protein